MDFILKNKYFHVIRNGFVSSTFANNFNPVITELRTNISNLSNSYQKKVTFSNDFNTCMHNIITLFGYDFAKNLFTIANFASDIESLIDELDECKDSKNIISKLEIIKTAIEMLLSNDKNYNTDLREFDKMITRLCEQIIEADNQYNYTNVNRVKNDAVNNCIDYLGKIIDDDNYEYVINDIDTLITNGKTPCCYIGSFLNVINVLYKQTFVDVPDEYKNIAIEYDVLKNINSDTTTIIYNYLTSIYTNCVELIGTSSNKIKIKCSSDLLDQLSLIIVNYLKIFSMNIFKVMLTATNSRITSKSIYQSILFTFPNGYCPNNSMLDTLKFIMLSKTDMSKLNDSFLDKA